MGYTRGREAAGTEPAGRVILKGIAFRIGRCGGVGAFTGDNVAGAGPRTYPRAATAVLVIDEETNK